MRSFSTIAKVSGVAVGTTALMSLGLFGATAASAEEQPIEPADAPEIMELAWPEYAVGDTHANVEAVSVYLALEENSEGDPYWDEEPTAELTEDFSEALLEYQADNGLGEHGEIKEEMWGHFSDAQFVNGVAWGPSNGEFYAQGDAGEGVAVVQGMLISHGYLDEGEADGQYGPATEEAVQDFQGSEICPEVSISQQECVDGLAGEVTYRALVAID